MIRHLNNVLALMTAGFVRFLAGKDAALRTWDRYKR